MALFRVLRNCLRLAGVFFMTAMGVDAAPRFKLQPPQYYFENADSLALLRAAMAGDATTARRLVAEGADPNDEGHLANPHNLFRPLHYAIAAQKPEAVRVLLEVGADPQMKTEGPGRPLMFAITLDDLEMLELMLHLKPLSTLAPDTIKSLLFRCVDIPRYKCLELLLKLGAPIDLRDGAGYTIMMSAMDVQDYDLAEWLLDHGASVHVETPGGVTPAYSVEFHLNKFIPGSPTYNKVLHLKKLMEERGAVFPAPSPAEVRAKRMGR